MSNKPLYKDSYKGKMKTKKEITTKRQRLQSKQIRKHTNNNKQIMSNKQMKV